MYTCDALWVRIIYFNSYCYVIWYTKYFIFVNLFLLSVNVLDFKYKSGGHSVLYLTQTTQMSPDYDNYMIIMMICTLVFVTVTPGRLMGWLIIPPENQPNFLRKRLVFLFHTQSGRLSLVSQTVLHLVNHTLEWLWYTSLWWLVVCDGRWLWCHSSSSAVSVTSQAWT